MFSTNFCGYNYTNPDYDVIDRPCGCSEHLFLYFQTPMRILLEGTLYEAAPGACIFITKNTKTYYEAVRSFTNSFVHIKEDELIDYLKSKYPFIPVNKLFYLPDTDVINSILKDIFREFVTKDYMYEETIDLLIKSLLIQIARQLKATSAMPQEHIEVYDIFQKARLTILSNPSEPWDSQSMARLTNLGSSQFYQYYKSFFNETPKADLLTVRLEKARYMLIHESYSIALVAEYSGFPNLSHFTRFFKKKYGVTPGEYRRTKTSSID